MRTLSLILFLFGVIAILTGCNSLLAQTAGSKKTESAHDRIKAEVQRIGTKFKMPNMFAGYQTMGKPFVGYAGGRRKNKSKIRVTLDDKIHLGSCTKAMTATMIARLIERGKLKNGSLTWETTIAQGLPQLSQELHASYQSVTLKQLLMHRGGCPTATNWILFNKDSITENRRAIVKAHLNKQHDNAPGTYQYSNLGYVVASLMASRATGKTWEDLMREEIFEPLELKSAGFGAPGTPGEEDQPWGHITRGNFQLPIQGDNPPALGPAGTVHMSLGDWAKFCLSHTILNTKGLTPEQKTEAEKLRLVSNDTLRFMHTPPENAKYALGWIATDSYGPKSITHAGSNTMWIAVTVTSLEDHTVYLAATSAASKEIGDGLDQIFEPMIGIRNQTADAAKKKKNLPPSVESWWN